MASALPVTLPMESTPRYLSYPLLKASEPSPAGMAVKTSSGDGPSPDVRVNIWNGILMCKDKINLYELFQL